jgi:hypothetical protein
LRPGEATLAAPREISGALALMMNAGKPGLHSVAGSSTVQPLYDYQGATVTASIDSVTLANGKFIGADTQNFFPPAGRERHAQEKVLSDLATNAKTKSAADVRQSLNAGKADADAKRGSMGAGGLTGFSLADIEVGHLGSSALVQLEHFGQASLSQWAEQENAKLQSKPSLHR